MALRIWLPLNGNLENKGISNITIINNGAIIDNNGKIGKCYYFNNSSYCYENTYDWSNFNTSAFSLCCWYKEPSPVASGNSQIICIGTSSGWNNIRIGLLRRTSNGYPMFSVSNGSSAIQYNFTATNFSLDVWNHIAVTYNNGTMSMYINGILDKTMNTTIVPVLNSSQHLGIGGASNGAEKLSGYLNDVRIYDHALSAKEVKEISQGLVLHYKLNQNLQILDNCYSYPTFDTSSANGGWSHWGRSGHVGNQGQNTDKTYIYNKQNTYSHWVSNDSTATGEYLVYQSPAFDGGYRSLQAIIKEENSKPIDETICLPDWNARNGGTPIGLWTSIVPLGDGFYLCKCEGISQDGSNDLVGIYVKPGYKIYLSEAYLENDKETCSEILYPRNYVIDSSGYGNDGIINGNLITNNNTSKYSSSTFFDGNTAAIKIPFNDIIKDKNYTVSCWTYKTTIGTKNYQTILGGPSGFELEARSSSSTSPLYRIHNWGGGTTPYEFNKWNHFCFVHTDVDSKLYVNGELKITGTSANIPTGNYFIGSWSTATSQNYEGQMSDFRIYATALSAEDVLDLYHTPANIDNLGGIHGFEFIEKTSNLLNPDPREWTKESSVTCVWNEETGYFDVNTNRDTSVTSRWGVYTGVPIKPDTAYLFSAEVLDNKSYIGVAGGTSSRSLPSNIISWNGEKRYYYFFTTSSSHTHAWVYLCSKPSETTAGHFKNIYLGEAGEIASIKQNGIFENEDMIEYNENGRITKSGELAGSNFIEK